MVPSSPLAPSLLERVGDGTADWHPPAVAPQSGPVGGRLRHFGGTWALYCTDRWVLQTVVHGYSLEFTDTPPSVQVRSTPVPRDQGKRAALEKEIISLLAKKAIQRVSGLDQMSGFMATFFLTPKKKQGEWRPILNLKPLNKFIRPPRFRMESLRTVLNSLLVPAWAASIDLKDAYLHVPICKEHRRFLRFRYKDTTFEFLTLPFGLSTAPRVFTRVTKALAAALRRANIMIFLYLDDWLVVGRSRQEVLRSLKITVELTESLGFLINLEKSHLVPTQNPTFLGAEINLVEGIAYPSDERKRNIQECATLFLTAHSAPAVAWLRLLGLMASLVDLVPYCRLRMRPLQLHLLAHYQPSRHPLSRQVPVLQPVKSHIRWWTQWSNLSVGLSFPPAAPTVVLTTDASNSGWGAHLQSHQVSGSWSPQELGLHINVLELLAVRKALLRLLEWVKGQTVMVQSDNSTVVSYINRQGGTHSPQLCFQTWDLLHWCIDQDIRLMACHIPGELNVIADALSRGKALPTEWQLHPVVVRTLFNMLDRPHIDLFASSTNNQLPVYCARNADPEAWAIDALTTSWSGMYAYAYPPISLLPLVLRKIQEEPCKVMLIAPFWPRQPWFQTLIGMLVHQPIILPDRPDLLRQPRSDVYHPSPETMHLTCWLLCNAACEQQAFLARLPPLQHVVAEHPPERHMTAASDIFIGGAKGGRWIHSLHL